MNLRRNFNLAQISWKPFDFSFSSFDFSFSRIFCLFKMPIWSKWFRCLRKNKNPKPTHPVQSSGAQPRRESLTRSESRQTRIEAREESETHLRAQINRRQEVAPCIRTTASLSFNSTSQENTEAVTLEIECPLCCR